MWTRSTAVFFSFFCSFLLLSFPDSITAQNDGDLRLSRGFTSSTTYSSGRLEIYYSGQWGTVCDDSWGISDSNVACRQLGYSGAISPYYATSSNVLGYGSGTGQIWLDDVGCSGSESRLTSCTNRGGFGSHNCAHSEDVAIYCSSVRISSTFTSPPTLTPTSTSGAVSQGDVRLVQGTFTTPGLSSGRVEIYINGEWGTVCDDLWGQTESDVVCRQLGFQRASSFGQADRNGFSQGTGEIWLDNVNCFGSDSSLLSCSHNGIGNENCGHTEDIAVFCTHSPLTTGAIIGIAVGSALAGLCLCIIFVAVLCICCSNSSSKRGTHRPLPAATTATAAYPTTTVVTGGQATSLYPSQPPPQPGAYPAQLTAYPAKGQEPPPPYPGQPIEMQPTAPQPGYLEQPAPYPTKAPTPYPIDPNQPAPYPGQPAPYPDQLAPYPGQPAPYPGQPAPYPGQLAPYPGQLAPYSDQPVPYS